MTTNISKIRDGKLTEDEKMELIADYLENGGGGGDEGNKTVFVYCTEQNGAQYKINTFSDPEHTKPMTSKEMFDAYKTGNPLVLVHTSTYGNATYNDVLKVHEGYSSGGVLNTLRFLILGKEVDANWGYDMGFLTTSDPSTNELRMTAYELQRKLTAGTGIDISGTTISATGGGGATVLYATDLANGGAYDTPVVIETEDHSAVDANAMRTYLQSGPVWLTDSSNNDIHAMVTGGADYNGDARYTIALMGVFDTGEADLRTLEYSESDGGWVTS